MASLFVERLGRGETLVADGATGTNLQDMGLGLGIPPEEWVFDQPEKVRSLHRAFIDAGADIILTDTFGGTRLRLRDSKYAGQVRELNSRAVELARQSILESKRTDALVGGSMGPTGMLMEPYGELKPDEAADAYAEQAAALAGAGADLLLLETFFALEEAQAAVEGIRRASTLPLVVSFSYDQGTRTMMGLAPSQVVDAFAPLGVAAIGANCGKTLDAMEQIVHEMAAKKTGIPLWIKPNAGLPRMVGDVAHYDVGPETMAEYAIRFVHAGARVVGGCCGSSPAHVKAIAQAVAGMSST